MTSLRSVVRLPARPLLARAADVAVCSQAFPGLGSDEVISITGGTPDGAYLFGVVRGEQGLRDGWLPSAAVQQLSPEEVAGVPPEARLTEVELLQRTTFVRVTEDWQDKYQPATLVAVSGELLQLGSVKDGWGFAWPPECQGQRGWLPLAFVQKVDDLSWAALATKERRLSDASAVALVDLLREQQKKRPPPPLPQPWEGEPPTRVTESARRVEREWKEQFDRRRAEEASARAATEAAEAAAEGEEEGEGPAAMGHPDGLTGEEYAEMLAEQGLPEDDLPLVVCKTPFNPPRGSSHLLELRMGDLVRVTSVMSDEVAMYHGFLERRRSEQGWFPRRTVQLIEDRWDGADSAPTPIVSPPLPAVPQNLQRIFWA